MHVLEEVGVVAVKHRAIVDGSGQVRGYAAAPGQFEIDAGDAAVVVESDVVVDDEVVSLAGHDHVVVAIEPQLARAPGLVRHQRRDAGDQRRLRLLAAEGATHAAAYDDNILRRAAGRMRDHALHFVRVLRRAVDEQAAVLLRQRHRDVALEIELVLAAAAYAPRQAIRRLFKCGGRIPARQFFRRQYERFLFDGIGGVDDCIEYFVVDLCEPYCLACAIHRRRRDSEQRVPGVLGDVLDEDRVVRNDRAEVVVARDVGSQQCVDDTARFTHFIEIDLADARMRMFAHADRDMQQVTRLRQVVGVGSLARDVQHGAVVRQRLADGTGRLLRGALNRCVHSDTPCHRGCRTFRGKGGAAGSARRAAGSRP